MGDVEKDRVCFPLTEYIIGDGTADKIRTKTRIVADEGSFGEIWQACENGRCRYILKYQRYREADASKALPAITRESIINEATIQRDLAQHKLAPVVKDAWLCEDGGSIVMVALKETIYSVMKQYSDANVHYMVLGKSLGMLRKLHNLGYYHGDSTIANIMVDFDLDDFEDAIPIENDIERYKAMNYRYYFIDMGLSGKLPEDQESRFERIWRDYQILGMSLHAKIDEYRQSTLGSGSDEMMPKPEANFPGLIDFMSQYLS